MTGSERPAVSIQHRPVVMGLHAGSPLVCGLSFVFQTAVYEMSVFLETFAVFQRVAVQFGTPLQGGEQQQQQQKQKQQQKRPHRLLLLPLILLLILLLLFHATG